MESIRSARSFTFPTPPLVLTLLAFATPSFAQDRNMLCDAGSSASVAPKALLDKAMKPLVSQIARITTQVAAIDKKYFKEKDKKAKGWQRLKNVRLPHLKSTLELMRSLREDLTALKTRLQTELLPLQASKDFVEKIGAMFALIKQEKDPVDRKVLAKRIELGVAVPLAAAQAKVQYLQQQLKQLQIWARSKNVGSLIKSTQQELKAAQAQATCWGQYHSVNVKGPGSAHRLRGPHLFYTNNT